MNPINISELANYFELLFAGHLLIFGIIGLLKWKSNREVVMLYLSCICLSVLLISGHFESDPFSQIVAFLHWTFFYLFIRDSLLPNSSDLNKYSFFALPGIWIILSILFPIQSYSHFQTIYFFHFILIALNGAHKTYRVNSSSLFGKIQLPNYLQWLHFGLIALIGSRLILPLIVLDLDTYMLVFLWLIALYFTGISAFHIGVVKANIPMHVEGTINLEDYINRKLALILKKDQAYLIPDLTITDLAIKMQMKTADLSSFFNSKLGMNFNDVVNQYRVEEVKRLIEDPSTDPKATIMELAYKSGFNSKATFNRIFKQLTDKTPKEYRNNHS